MDEAALVLSGLAPRRASADGPCWCVWHTAVNITTQFEQFGPVRPVLGTACGLQEGPQRRGVLLG